MRQGTDNFPNKEIQARAREMEANGEALIATLFSGFPHADIHNAGLSAVVVTDGDPEAARRLCDELLEMGWRDREAWVYQIEPLEDRSRVPRTSMTGRWSFSIIMTIQPLVARRTR